MPFFFTINGQKKTATLFEAKAYKNGNVHIKFNQTFICRLNVEFGRLKGWIKSPKEAAQELDVPLEKAEKSFHSTIKIENDNILRIETQAVA